VSLRGQMLAPWFCPFSLIFIMPIEFIDYISPHHTIHPQS
jgi:hypothetical protein